MFLQRIYCVKRTHTHTNRLVTNAIGSAAAWYKIWLSTVNVMYMLLITMASNVRGCRHTWTSYCMLYTYGMYVAFQWLCAKPLKVEHDLQRYVVESLKHTHTALSPKVMTKSSSVDCAAALSLLRFSACRLMSLSLHEGLADDTNGRRVERCDWWEMNKRLG